MPPAEKVRSIRKPKATYLSKSGEPLVGVTTVLRLRNKEALVEWAFNLGRSNPQLQSSRQYVDELARVGTCAHEMVGAALRNEPCDLSDFTPKEVEAANWSFGKFLEWRKGRDVQVVAVEKMVISERYRYGGTLDVLAVIDGKRTLLDLKTSKAIYPEQFVQCSAYAEAEAESGEPVAEVAILRLGRSHDEGFETKSMTSWANEFWQFLALRTLYDVEASVKAKRPWSPSSVAHWFQPRLVSGGKPAPTREVVHDSDSALDCSCHNKPEEGV